MRRYGIAIILGCLILASAAGFCMLARQSFVDYVRAELRKPENASTASPEMIQLLDQGVIPPELADFAAEVPPALLWRLQVMDVLAGYWYVWAVVVFGGCFAVAHHAGRR